MFEVLFLMVLLLVALYGLLSECEQGFVSWERLVELKKKNFGKVWKV